MQITPSAIVISELEDVRRMVSAYRARPASFIGFDIETNGLSPFNDPIAALQFKQGDHKPTIIDVRQYDGEMMQDLGTALEPLFDGSVTILGQNIKFDLKFLQHDCKLRAHEVYDIMLAEQVIYSLGISSGRGVGIEFNMLAIAGRYDIHVEKESRDWFIGLASREEWHQPFPQRQIDYMAQDVNVLMPIALRQQTAIQQYRLEDTVSLENRALLAIVDMELSGIKIDIKRWQEVLDETKREVEVQEKTVLDVLQDHILSVRNERFDVAFAIWKEWKDRRDSVLEEAKKLHVGPGWGEKRLGIMAEWKFVEPRKPHADTSLPNMGSSQQVKEALNHMKLTLPGQREPLVFESVSSEALVNYEEAFDIIHDILVLRKGQKLLQAFGDKLLEKVNPTTGRLYAEYNQIGADTGRMSSFNPNFQQIPSKGIGARLRECVVADTERQLCVADFSNIELRILADLSGDKRMNDLFSSGKDMHSETARMMFNLPESIDPATTDAVINGRVLLNTPYRKIAKTINFGLVYGMSASKLARTLKIDTNLAKELMSKYFDMYRGVDAWLKEQHFRLDTAIRLGSKRCVSYTVGGRPRFYDIPDAPAFPDVRTHDAIDLYQQATRDYKGVCGGIKRKLANSPIQGTSADITKLALAMWREGFEQDTMHLVAVVHDELIVEVARGYEEQAKVCLSSCMDQAQRHYLTKVTLPAPKAGVYDHWQHE